MLRAYRYRFYPTSEQVILLLKTFGCCRFVYNLFLDEKQKRYRETQKTLSYGDCAKMLSDLKEEMLWLSEVSSVPLQQALRHLDKGFQKFYKRQARFPKYKKKNDPQSATFMKNSFKYEEGKLTLAKFNNPLDIRWSRRFKGDPSSATVSIDSKGRYYISILVEEEIARLPGNAKTIGIDLGLTNAFVTSDGEKESPPRALQKQLKKLKRRQRELSRKIKGSANRTKAKKVVGALCSKVRDQRLDYIHKMTTALVHENQVICAETLSVKKMMKNKHLARGISDAGWGMFLQFLEYKCAWYGRVFVKIDRFFPSTKQCSECKNVNQSLTLKDREWTCLDCNSFHDRDLTAARNIEEEGLRQVSWSTVGLTGIKACGADVRPMWQPTGLSAMKQEPELQSSGISFL
jgi:putative transposase